MTIKKWAAAGMAALTIAAGGFSVQADSVTLAGGEKVDLGQKVNVLDGDKTFFGAQMKEWISDPAAETAMENLLRKKGVFAENSPEYSELSRMAVQLLRDAKLYQVRAVANETYYQGMMLSLSVADADLHRLEGYRDAAVKAQQAPDVLPAAETEAVPAGKTGTETDGRKEESVRRSDHYVPEGMFEKDEDLTEDISGKIEMNGKKEEKPVLTEEGKAVEKLFRGAVKVESAESWQEETSRKGIVYRSASARLDLERNGFAIPLFVKGIIMKDNGRTSFTIFAADQASGKYFDPILDKALRGASK